MIQGTGSHVGKSPLVAGLARALTRRGLAVRPFKPQNMSNNAAVTADRGEIGRAQALQARAARVPPSVHMNPVLLKPESDVTAQVIVQGRRVGRWEPSAYLTRKPDLLAAVLDSFHRLAAEADIVLVEGAGSPAEINLRAGDIANMGFAEAADVPVILAGDIDRGGVIASLVGTHAVLPQPERQRIIAFLINKFRGDMALFDEGLTEIARRTGWLSLGIVPWFAEAARLPAEDAVDLERRHSGEAALTIAVPMLPRIANFDDLDPLALEPDVRVIFVPPGTPVPAAARVVILPGTKATIADLAFVRAQGGDIDISAHVRRGGHLVGLCGGYQMLGRSIADPEGIEGPAGAVPGLGWLDVVTVLTPDKVTRPASGLHLATGTPVGGYEIHLGRTDGPDTARPAVRIDGRPDGAVSADGAIMGTYLHGLFASDAFRRAWLAGLGARASDGYEQTVDATLDALADHLEQYTDIDAMLAIARATV
jgi:adenosylcobyric acid synthase